MAAAGAALLACAMAATSESAAGVPAAGVPAAGELAAGEPVAGLPAPARERGLPALPGTAGQGKSHPVVSKSRPPLYPAEARQLGQQGRVVVRALVDAQGQVAYAEVKESSGHPLLDQAALATVRGWSFMPGTRQGVPEAMWARIPINFSLEGKSGR